MFIKNFIVCLSLCLTACAQGSDRNSSTPPNPSDDFEKDHSTSSLKLVGDGYVLLQGEGIAEVKVPSLIPGQVELMLDSCFDAASNGYFKTKQGDTVPFSQVMISLAAASRGNVTCKNTFAISLPVMQEIEGSVHIEYTQSGQKKTFSRPFAAVAKEKLKIDGGSGSGTDPNKPNTKHEDDLCGGPCEKLISEFLDGRVGRITAVFADVYAHQETSKLRFAGDSKKGQFTRVYGVFPFDEGSYEVRDSRLVLSDKVSAKTLAFAYLPIIDNGVLHPALHAATQEGSRKTSYYIW